MRRTRAVVLCVLAQIFLCLSLLAPLDDAWANGGQSPERQTVPFTRTPRPTATHTPLRPTATSQASATPTVAQPGNPPAQATATPTTTPTATATETAIPQPSLNAPATAVRSATPQPATSATTGATGTPVASRTRPPALSTTTAVPVAGSSTLPMAVLEQQEGGPGAGSLLLCAGSVVGLVLVALGTVLRRR